MAELSSGKNLCCSAERPPCSTPLNGLGVDLPAQHGAPFARTRAGSTSGMKPIPGGPFLLGTDDTVGYPADGEGPVREVVLSPFFMDITPVSNRQFTGFVRETGYRTDAERFGWSFVFHLHVPRKLRPPGVAGLEWWRQVEGANWRHPEGPGSNVRKRQDYPVVHVSWADAQAYCDWSGKRLPTEAEWETAARGGLIQKRFVWGDELLPGGQHQCNIWQGEFPLRDTGADGYAGTSPGRSYAPNGYGLYSMAGNVWEWCFDWFDPVFHRTADRTDPFGPPTGDRRVIRGGSFLCHESYCNRYRVAARTANTPDSSTANMGFRCVLDG